MRNEVRVTLEPTVRKLSVVVPTKDEENTLEPLYLGIASATEGLGSELEVIFVDDGSRDRSWAVMQQLAAGHPQVHALRLRRNFGKAIALAAGFQEAGGDVVITMDADLQDDPQEIPRFLSKLAEGYDVVSGWKANRQDPPSKTLPSRLFNRVIARVSGIPLHDFNCGFKAYRREAIEDIRLYGELHRYIPVLAHDLGFRIGELPVRHHPRRHGVSKYGWERYARGFLDLLTVLVTTRYLQKPAHLFGGLGLVSGILGGLALTYLAVLWFLKLGPIGTRPLLFAGILLVILSAQMLSLGMLAEIINRHADSRPPRSVVAARAGGAIDTRAEGAGNRLAKGG